MAGGFNEGFDSIALNAAVDMSSAQYALCRINSGKNGEVVICSVAAEEVDGVVMNKPTSGQTAQIGVEGVMPFRAGAAINAGDKVITNATGWGLTSTISGATGKALITVTSGAVGTMIKFSGHQPQQA